MLLELSELIFIVFDILFVQFSNLVLSTILYKGLVLFGGAWVVLVFLEINIENSGRSGSLLHGWVDLLVLMIHVNSEVHSLLWLMEYEWLWVCELLGTLVSVHLGGKLFV